MDNSRRKLAQNFSAFKTAIGAPADMLTPFAWPANCRFAISYSTPLAQGDLTVNVGPKGYKTPALAANQVHRMEYANRGKLISYTTAIPGKLKLYVLDEWNRPYLVAQNP